MEVAIDMMESDGSVVKNVQHDEDVYKEATGEAGSSESLNSDNESQYHDDDDDDGDYMFENFEQDDESHYLSMQAQFDNVDLPPGVEASFSWLNNHEIPNITCKNNDIASSSLSVLPNITSSSVVEKEDETKEEVKKKFENFKSFDIVDDISDHHFSCAGFEGQQMVYYYSGGLRLNPNLYESGKVCLSLLNTWTGEGSEKWMPDNSTMLQVLVSIQALILNDKPFFNEPGYDNMYTGALGEKKSRGYNEDIFILSLKTMIYTLRRPPKHFEDLVVGHFSSRAHVILSACRAYMEGLQVGSMVKGDDKTSSKQFKSTLGRMINGLVSNFSRYGATDCDQYHVES